MSKIEKIFPTAEELSLVTSQVRCSEENCSSVFKSTSNLNMHLIRHHKISGEELCRKDGIRQFYCPSNLCIYNRDSKKYFTKLKYLKQHFLKVHAIKNYSCHKCDKKFSTESFQKMHEKTCGNSFHCNCGFIYNSLEALLTHCKRKGHQLMNSIKSDKLIKKESIKKSERLICPKITSEITYPIHHIAAIALSELSNAPFKLSKLVDKGIQTEFSKSMREIRKNYSNHVKIESSQETQTIGRLKNNKINTQTQTNADYLKNKIKNLSKLSIIKKRKKSMETQTKDYLNHKNDIIQNDNDENDNNKKRKCQLNQESKFFIYEDDNLFNDEFLKNGDDDNNINQNDDDDDDNNLSYINKDELLNKRTKLLSSSTDKNHDLFDGNSEIDKEFDHELNDLKMSCKNRNNENENLDLIENGSYNVFDINKLCNIETQTEIDVFLNECNDDSSFTLCSTTETQTIDFDPLLYSNMCTQTPDEVNQLFSFNFVDIETQTAWPDL